MTRRGTHLLTGLLILLYGGTAWASNVGAGNVSWNTFNNTWDNTINFDTDGATLSIDVDDNTELINATGITVANGVDATIAFVGTNKLYFGDNNSQILLNGTGTLTITGGSAGAGFDMATTATNKSLTINKSITGNVSGNTFIMGNNTLQTTTGNPVTLNAASLGGANATLDIDTTTTLATLTLTGALNITPADTQVLTLTNAVALGANKLTITGTNGGGAEAVNGTFTLDNGSSELETAGGDVDDVLGDATINVTTDAATLDVNFNTSPTAINLSNDLNLEIADGKTLTSTVDLNGHKVTFPATSTGTVSAVTADIDGSTIQADANATVTTLTQSNDTTIGLGDGVTFTITNAFNTGGNKLTLAGSGAGGQETLAATVQLDNSSAELEINGVDVDNIKGYTVTVTADGPTIDANVNTSPTAINQTAAAGDVTLAIATGKAVTSTVDVNDNVLTLSETGSVSAVSFDTAGGTVQMNANGTIASLTHTASSKVKLGDGVSGTIQNAVSVGNGTLTIEGSGGNNQDTLNATITANNPNSVVLLTGNSADNLKGMTVNLSTDGSTLDVDASASPTDVVVTADATIDVASSQTLTADIDFSTNTLIVSGAGSLTQLRGSTGTLGLNGTNTITTLTANPGASSAFTINGSGQSTIGTFTPLDTSGENLVKAGTGVVTLTNGFSFGSSTGVQLLINGGTLIDAGGAAITFGDEAEKVLVSSGATYTTSSDFTGHAGSSTNLEGEAGSTVNFAKSGVQRLTATADDDFTMLGTVNIEDGTTLTLGGAFTFEFGDVNIADTGALVNSVGDSSMLFVPSSTVTLEGTASGTLTINGQGASSLVTLDTTTGTGSWTLDRGASDNLTLSNVSIANMIYTSDAGGTLEGEVDLSGVVDGGGNENGFTDVTADAGPDKEIIAGNSTTLDGSASGGSGNYTFSWSPATGLSSTTSATPTASPTETTVYTLTVTDEDDTSKTATDTVEVTVTTGLAVSAGEDKTIVAGESVVLEGLASGGSGQLTYAWTPVTGLSDPSSPFPVASPTETTTYMLTVTDTGDNETTASDTVIVTVTPAGVVTNCGAGTCGAGTAMLMPLMVFSMLMMRRRR